MKLLLVTVTLLAASSTRTCGKDDDAGGAASSNVSAEAQATAAAAPTAAAATLATPRIGGSIAVVGNYSVELVVHQAGRVEALVADAAGKLQSDVKLSVSASVKSGQSEAIELAFSEPRARFEGRAKAGVELASGPLGLSLEAGGKKLEAKLALVAALPEPALGGHVLSAGAFTSELFLHPNGQVRAFVRDAAGAELKADAEVKASVRTSAGATEELALAFDAPHACFSGHAKAGTQLAPGPVKLSISAGGTLGVGGLADVALAVDASHGGQIVAVGNYSVELVAKGPVIQAFVFDATGKAHAAGDLNLKLDFGAASGGSALLAWDAPSLSYKGRAAAGLDVSSVPIRISLVAGGKAHAGAIASLKAAVGAKVDANAKADLGAKANLDAKADVGAQAKLKAPDVKAKVDATAAKAANASAKVQVTPPKVKVSAEKSAGTKAGGGAKAGGSFSFGTK